MSQILDERFMCAKGTDHSQARSCQGCFTNSKVRLGRSLLLCSCGWRITNTSQNGIFGGMSRVTPLWRAGNLLWCWRKCHPARGGCRSISTTTQHKRNRLRSYAMSRRTWTARLYQASIVVYREYRCPACSHPWDESVVQNWLRQSQRDNICLLPGSITNI